jgi:biofilm PGA synthesis lipoprotein PgaB
VRAVALVASAALAAFATVAAGPLGAAPAARAAKPASPKPIVAILCYHDLSSDTTGATYTIVPDSLRAHIRRAKRNGWVFRSLSQVLAARGRPGRLPAKTMVVTFDDGYRSFAEVALPILRAEKVKATLSIVTSWVDDPPDELPPLLTWDEIRDLDQSGDVEIASHSHAQHRFETCNPFDDTTPAVSTRRYLPDEERYETRDEYEARIADDMEASRRRRREELGHDVDVLAWPYGEWTQTAWRLAREAGYKTALGLEGDAVPADSIRTGRLSRVMVYREVPVGAKNTSWLGQPKRTFRAAAVDIDDLYDKNSKKFDQNVARAIERLKHLGASDVILQGLPDPAGDQTYSQAWFMNHQVPVRADVWSVVALRLARQRMRVWLRVPTMNLTWAMDAHPESCLDRVADLGIRSQDRPLARLSPAIPEARRAVADFYNDLAVYLPITGVVFDDDAFVAPAEWLTEESAGTPIARTTAIRGLLEEAKESVRAWRPRCRFARVVGGHGRSLTRHRTDFAQDLPGSLKHDDIVLLEGEDPEHAVAIRRANRRGVLAYGVRPRSGIVDVAEAVRKAERAGIEDVAILGDALEADLPEGLLRIARPATTQKPYVSEAPQDVRR